MNKCPKISVIIPVYKVENYLSQCVDSVIQQTYKNLEIILVDDGSPDSSPQICDNYAKLDNRIITIHKKKWRTILCSKCRLRNSVRRVCRVC